MKNSFKIIDSHCHVYPEKIVDKAVCGTDNFYGVHSHCKGSIENLLQVGESAGVDRYIIQSVATTPKQVASINAFIANEVSLNPDKLVGLGTLHQDSQSRCWSSYKHLPHYRKAQRQSRVCFCICSQVSACHPLYIR